MKKLLFVALLTLAATSTGADVMASCGASCPCPMECPAPAPSCPAAPGLFDGGSCGCGSVMPTAPCGC